MPVDESEKSEDHALLMEVFEARERISEASNKTEVEEVNSEIQQNWDISVQKVRTILSDTAFSLVTQSTFYPLFRYQKHFVREICQPQKITQSVCITFSTF
jgi:hypothetical protein